MQLRALQMADMWASYVTVITNLSHFVSILMQLIKDVGDGRNNKVRATYILNSIAGL
jgi:hypothetical protein